MAADRLELLPTGLQTASGAGAWLSVPNADNAVVVVDVTAVSSLTAFDVYLEGSVDGGTTAVELSPEWTMEHSGAAGAGSTVYPDGTTVRRRNIVNSDETTGKYVAVYRNLPDRIRASWQMTGTSVTFSVKAVVK